MSKILILPNEDKQFHEEESKDKRCFSHPFKAIICGPTNSGKSNVIRTLVAASCPGFEEIYVWHASPETTREYDIMNPTAIMSGLPEYGELSGNETKKLLIIEDINLLGEKKPVIEKLCLLLSHFCTHNGWSVIITGQNPYMIPPRVRILAHKILLFRFTDNILGLFGKNLSLNSKSIHKLFADKLRDEKHSFLCFDTTQFTCNKNFDEDINLASYM